MLYASCSSIGSAHTRCLRTSLDSGNNRAYIKQRLGNLSGQFQPLFGRCKCFPTKIQRLGRGSKTLAVVTDNSSTMTSSEDKVESIGIFNVDIQVIVFERGDLVFVFNFHPENIYDGYKVPGRYRVALDSDSWEFGGQGMVGLDVDHFMTPKGIPGVPETNFNNRPNSFKVLSPPRICVTYYRVDESQENGDLGLDDMTESPASDSLGKAAILEDLATVEDNEVGKMFDLGGY